MNAEERFRAVEQVLDRLLAEDTSALNTLTICDLSGRTYHYKNQYLSWSYQFSQDTPVDYETKRISVDMTFVEPVDLEKEDVVTVFIRSELFQQGRASRIDEKSEYLMTLLDLEHSGLAACVNVAFQKGEEILTIAHS